MKCPECSGDMEKGNFSLPNNTVWTPTGVKVKFGVMAEDMVWLAKRWNLALLCLDVSKHYLR